MTKRQTKKGSMLEATGNVALGFMVALLVWEFAVRPAIHAGYLSVDDSIYITIIFTVVSLVRGYVVRRIGNKWLR